MSSGSFFVVYVELSNGPPPDLGDAELRGAALYPVRPGHHRPAPSISADIAGGAQLLQVRDVVAERFIAHSGWS